MVPLAMDKKHQPSRPRVEKSQANFEHKFRFFNILAEHGPVKRNKRNYYLLGFETMIIVVEIVLLPLYNLYTFILRRVMFHTFHDHFGYPFTQHPETPNSQHLLTVAIIIVKQPEVGLHRFTVVWGLQLGLLMGLNGYKQCANNI
jgi:hypothetical protein